VQRGIEQMPALESTASRTLADARPLLREARPLARDVAAAAPDLNAALVDLRPVVGDADTVLAGVPRLYRQALPFLRQATAVMRLAQPVAGPLGAALRNLTPIATYLSARRSAFAAWFTNTGDLGSHRDAKGYFARFFVGFDPETSFGAPSSFQTNAYTGPNDAAANRPYSGYPRLEPYNPPAEESGQQSSSGG
jgi:ABC-type transporter Mla subunit MlaD